MRMISRDGRPYEPQVEVGRGLVNSLRRAAAPNGSLPRIATLDDGPGASTGRLALQTTRPPWFGDTVLRALYAAVVLERITANKNRAFFLAKPVELRWIFGFDFH